MVDPEDGAMIALLPTTSDWCKIDLPHLTLVYAGAVNDLKPSVFNELAKDAAMISMLSSAIGLKVMAKETFGSMGEVDAFRLEPSTSLWAMRRSVERWNASEYSFNPHVTIGPAGSIINVFPSYLVFDRIMVGWGDEKLVFWLKQ